MEPRLKILTTLHS